MGDSLQEIEELYSEISDLEQHLNRVLNISRFFIEKNREILAENKNLRMEWSK